jgi:hypothetical protein
MKSKSTEEKMTEEEAKELWDNLEKDRIREEKLLSPNSYSKTYLNTDLIRDFGFPNISPEFLFVRKNLLFGICSLDLRECYIKGAICRLNPIAGFQSEYDYANPQVRKPLRNKDCSNFRKVQK